MKFIVLFMCTLKYIYGNITQKIITKVNKDVFKGDDLMLSILNPFFGYTYGDMLLSRTRYNYFFQNPNDINLIFKIYSEEQSTGVLSAVLSPFFPSTKKIFCTSNFSNSCLTQKYFLNNSSRSDSIKIFATFFVKLLKNDELFTLEKCTLNKYKITDPILLEILIEAIGVDQNTLALTLLTLHAFMLQVLDTEDEFKEYVSNIINFLSKDDKEIIKASPNYYLKFENVKSNLKENEVFNILYNIPHYKFLFYFYKQLPIGMEIPAYNRLIDDYDENSRFNDFVDVTLLQLCNFLFYNEEKEQFDLEHLNLDKDSNLFKFYNKYKKPFYFIDQNTRKEWSKVIQCLNDINIIDKKYNKNLGLISFLDNSTRTVLSSSILNIVTVLTKICSSRHNNIKKIYIKLFDREFKANNTSDLVQEFLNLIVNKSVYLECIGKGIKVADNLIYGELKITTITNNKELTRQLSYIFRKKYIYTSFNEDYLFIDKLKTIKFESNDYEQFNPLEFIMFSCVNILENELNKKTYRSSNFKLLFRN